MSPNPTPRSVLGHGGTLKTEHGTGRMMAPHAARQYGDGLHAATRATKRLLDPHNLLNSGAVCGPTRVSACGGGGGLAIGAGDPSAKFVQLPVPARSVRQNRVWA